MSDPRFTPPAPKPRLALTPRLHGFRCVRKDGTVVTESVAEGSVCVACGVPDTATGYPGKRWLVTGWVRTLRGRLAQMKGRHLVCHECLVFWDVSRN
jgi:hypothetical protein